MDAVNHMGGEGVGGGRKRVWCGAVCLRLCFHHFVAAHCLVDALRSFLSSPPISHLPLRAAQPQRLCARPLQSCGMRKYVIWWMKRKKEREGEPTRGAETVTGW